MEKWYNDRKVLEGELKEGGLATLNSIAHARNRAHYVRKEPLNEFVFLGRFWSDTCGNFGRIQWDNLTKKAPLKWFPLVATREEWSAFLKESGLKMDTISMAMDLPPEYAECDICHKRWTIDDCHKAVVIRVSKDLPLEEFVGTDLIHVQIVLKRNFHTIVFIQPDVALHNLAYKGLESHPVYPELRIRNGLVYHPDLYKYIVQPGDVGHFNIWYFRHPECQQGKLEKSEREYFSDIFQKAEFKEVTLSQIPNEYCGDPTCCPPWFLIQTEHGKFKIGWRKRVINIELMDETLKQKCNLDLLFAGEAVTKGPDSIHAWGDSKAIEYLKTINAIQIAYS